MVKIQSGRPLFVSSSNRWPSTQRLDASRAGLWSRRGDQSSPITTTRSPSVRALTDSAASGLKTRHCDWVGWHLSRPQSGPINPGRSPASRPANLGRGPTFKRSSPFRPCRQESRHLAATQTCGGYSPSTDSTFPAHGVTGSSTADFYSACPDSTSGGPTIFTAL